MSEGLSSILAGLISESGRWSSRKIMETATKPYLMEQAEVTKTELRWAIPRVESSYRVIINAITPR